MTFERGQILARTPTGRRTSEYRTKGANFASVAPAPVGAGQAELISAEPQAEQISNFSIS